MIAAVTPHSPPLFSNFVIALCSVRHLFAYPLKDDVIYEQPLKIRRCKNYL